MIVSLTCRPAWIATVFLSAATLCGGATLEVGPGKPHAAIQAAIDAAGNGDTILVYSGTYDESLTVDKPGLTIKEAPDQTAIYYPISGSVEITAPGLVWEGIDINASGSRGYIAVRDSAGRTTSGTVFRNFQMFDERQSNGETSVGWAAGFIVEGSVLLDHVVITLDDTHPRCLAIVGVPDAEAETGRSTLGMGGCTIRMRDPGNAMIETEGNAPEVVLLDTTFQMLDGDLSLPRPMFETLRSRDGLPLSVADSRIIGGNNTRAIGDNVLLNANRSVFDVRPTSRVAINIWRVQGWTCVMRASAVLMTGYPQQIFLMGRQGGALNMRYCTVSSTADSSVLGIDFVPPATSAPSIPVDVTLDNNIFRLVKSSRGVIADYTRNATVTLHASLNMRYYGATGVPAEDFLNGTIIDADPLLAEDRIHLRRESPAINQLEDLQTTYDIDNQERTHSELADLGADQVDLSDDGPISIFAPGPGQVVAKGDTIKVGWRTRIVPAGTAVQFMLYSEHGMAADLGTAFSPTGAGIAQLTIPDVQYGEYYFIRARSTWDTTIFADSPGLFTIVAEAVQPKTGTQQGWETYP